MPKKRLPAIGDRAVWEVVTTGRAGIRRDSVVVKVWKDIGGNREYIMSILVEKFGGYKTEEKERMEGMKRLALRSDVQRNTNIWEVKGRDRNENMLARPNGLRDNSEFAISRRQPGTSRKRKGVYQ